MLKHLDGLGGRAPWVFIGCQLNGFSNPEFPLKLGKGLPWRIRLQRSNGGMDMQGHKELSG
jgi:hypothetical protein